MSLYGHGITCRNVNDGFARGMELIRDAGVLQPSRYGDVLAVDGPVMVVYNKPRERVLFNAARDCNPFFHFVESLWMLAGKNDVPTVAHYAKRMSEFSDDGSTFHGAYGYRWRRHFWLEGEHEVDQLPLVGQMLKDDRTTRRAVLAMWDPVADLLPRGDGKVPKDLPCNTHIYFRVRRGSDDPKLATTDVLDMTVCNRSNDIIWGLFGANAVHMSFLHEYVAAKAELPVGKYVQMTNNFHAYTKVYEPLIEHTGWNEFDDPYQFGTMRPYPLVRDSRTWDTDLMTFFTEGAFQRTLFSNPFFYEVAQPIVSAFEMYKKKRHRHAHDILNDCGALDWREACQQWIERRSVVALNKGNK